MMTELANLFLGYFHNLNYISITALMTVESSFIPFPSEVVMPPAGWLASQGQLNLFLVIICGTLGSLLGALINYFLARYLGRTILYSLINTPAAKWLFLSQKKLERAEKYFQRYGNVSTLIGRLLPAVRQLISLPAGLAKMNLKNFIIYTVIGAGLWNIILTLLGYWLGANWLKLNINLYLLSWIGLILFITFLIWLWTGHKKNK